MADRSYPDVFDTQGDDAQNLLVFTVATRRYEPFVLPYLASFLHHNPGANVEIRMGRPEQFTAENRPALDLLGQHFPHRFSLTSFFQDDGLPQSGSGVKLEARNSIQLIRWLIDEGRSLVQLLRWLQVPERMAEFVYIGDLDILVLEEIAPTHLTHMGSTGLPFSNVQRPNRPALTGLHFTRYDAYYPQVDVNEQYIGWAGKDWKDNERLLYWLVEQKGFGLPDPTDKFRPYHGYHLSLNANTAARGSGKGAGWQALGSREFLTRYSAFSRTELWQELTPLLDHRYRQLLSMLDIALAQLFPEETSERRPAPGTRPKDLW